MEDAAAPNSGSDLNFGGKRGRSIEECQDMIRRSFRSIYIQTKHLLFNLLSFLFQFMNLNPLVVF